MYISAPVVLKKAITRYKNFRATEGLQSFFFDIKGKRNSRRHRPKAFTGNKF